MSNLLHGPFGVVNIGLKRFADDLSRADVEVIDINWQPPAGSDPELARKLADLVDNNRGLGSKIRDANHEAFTRLIESQPMLKDIVPALDILPDMSPTTILHAGPPIHWEQMIGAMRGAVIGGLLYEGLVSTPEEAEKLAASGKITFAPCHAHGAVGPMAGILTPHMPVMVVENEKHGSVAYASMNEGWGRTLRFGAYDPQVIDRLRWMRDVLAPTLRAAISHKGGIDVKSLIARALHMGDECHNRDLAATSLFYKEIAPAMVAAVEDHEAVFSSLDFLSSQEHFFLNIGMAACKAGLVAASHIPFSTMVTAIARNGVDIGIQVSGAGNKWFTAKAEVPQGLYFPGYSEADANPDLGDSAITETFGIGAFAMAAAPAIVRFVGGTPYNAIQYTEEMYEITIGENPNFSLPSLDFRGTPTGIDVRAVIESGITPVVNTGIAHKEAGHGLVGAGVVRIPIGAFEKAVNYLHKQWEANGTAH